MRPTSLLLERVDRHRHGEVRLAGAGRSDAERHRVVADRVDVALLAGGLGPDRLAAVRQDDVGEDLRRAALARLSMSMARSMVSGVSCLPALDELDAAR